VAEQREQYQVEWEPIERLKPAAYNPRELPDDERASLKRSLQTFGAVEPAVFNDRTDELVGGHQRVMVAAEDLGWTTYPTHHVDLEPEQARLLNLALNRIAGRWDVEKLTDLVGQLREGEAPLELSGFSTQEVDDLLDLGNAPDLDALRDQYGGAPQDDDFWPTLRFKVSPEEEARFRRVTGDVEGDDRARFVALLEAAE
jgi:hypothetical protein